MASSKKIGYVITRAASLKEYFTSSTSYDRPQWVPLSEASVYVSPELAQQAAKKLWMKGSFAAKVQSIQELLDIEMDMAPKKEPLPGEEGKEQDSEMVAAKQGDPALDGEVEGVCPECDCEPCECDDAALADGEPTDHIPTDDQSFDALPSEEMPPEDELRLGAEHEEDSMLGQHLKRAAGMENEETSFKVGDTVVPHIGPHKGVKHKVVHVHKDGDLNIVPIGVPTARIVYRLGAAKARPNQVKAAGTEDVWRSPGTEGEENARLHPEEIKMLGKKRMDMKEDSHWKGISATHRKNVEKTVTDLKKDGHEVYMVDTYSKKNKKPERTILNIRMKDGSTSERIVKEDEFKMPTRPGNDPATPDENKDTVPNLKAPYDSNQIQFKDPVGTEDKPDTDLYHAVAQEHEDKVNVPADLLSQLKAVVAEFTKAAEDNNNVDDVKGSFALTAASALQQLVDDLELGTVAGIKQAQIHMTSYMNPITSHIPEDVLKFIAYGGRKPSLKDLFAVKWENVRGAK